MGEGTHLGPGATKKEHEHVARYLSFYFFNCLFFLNLTELSIPCKSRAALHNICDSLYPEEKETDNYLSGYLYCLYENILMSHSNDDK